MQESQSINEYQQRQQDRQKVEAYLETYVHYGQSEAMAAFHRLVGQHVRAADPTLSWSLGDLFRMAEDTNAAMVAVKLFRNTDDEMPFRAVVLLNDEPRLNARVLDALDELGTDELGTDELGVEPGVEVEVEGLDPMEEGS